MRLRSLLYLAPRVAERLPYCEQLQDLYNQPPVPYIWKERISLAPRRKKRNMGMIFQNYALWPHMTVKNNIAFGLRIRKMKKDEINDIVSRLISQLLQVVQ